MCFLKKKRKELKCHMNAKEKEEIDDDTLSLHHEALWNGKEAKTMTFLTFLFFLENNI